MAITNSDLPFILERVNGRWPNNRVQADYTPEVATLRSIIDNQTADIRAFGLPLEQASYVTWLLNCGQEPEACADDCDFSGPSASTFRQTLSIDQCIENSFSESYDVWYKNEFGMMDAVSSQLMRIMKDHLEAVEQYSVAVINANSGVNASTPIGWTTAGTITTVPADQITSTAIYGPLQRNARRNRFDNPYLLSGEALAQLEYLAQTNAGNLDGRGDSARAAQFKKYFDLFNVDEVNDPNLDFYMIDMGILAFGSKGYWPLVGDPTNPRGAQEFSYGKMRFSVRNRWVPELIHDIQVEDRCTTGVDKQNWNVKTRYKTAAAPQGCLTDNTGILHYRVEAGA